MLTVFGPFIPHIEQQDPLERERETYVVFPLSYPGNPESRVSQFTAGVQSREYMAF
jgi:hypothetical protein